MQVPQLIEKLGGTGAVASLLGLSPQSVSMMKAAGSIPEKHHFRLYRLCQERGIDWRPPEPEAA